MAVQTLSPCLSHCVYAKPSAVLMVVGLEGSRLMKHNASILVRSYILHGHPHEATPRWTESESIPCNQETVFGKCTTKMLELFVKND